MRKNNELKFPPKPQRQTMDDDDFNRHFFIQGPCREIFNFMFLRKFSASRVSGASLGKLKKSSHSSAITEKIVKRNPLVRG